MKIAMVFDGLQIGGIERVGADYAKILKKLGHDVTVVNLVPRLNEMEKEFPADCTWIKFNYPRRVVREQYEQLVKKGFLGTICYLGAMTVMPMISFALKIKFKLPLQDILMIWILFQMDLSVQQKKCVGYMGRCIVIF